LNYNHLECRCDRKRLHSFRGRGTASSVRGTGASVPLPPLLPPAAHEPL